MGSLERAPGGLHDLTLGGYFSAPLIFLGRPKEANRSWSWKAVLRLMPDSVTVKTWRVFRAYPPSGARVGGQRGLPVRVHRHHAPVRAPEGEDACDEADVRLAADVPVEERWHLQYDGIGQQLLQSGQVGVLEGDDIAFDLGAVDGVGGLVDLVLAQRTTTPTPSGLPHRGPDPRSCPARAAPAAPPMARVCRPARGQPGPGRGAERPPSGGRRSGKLPYGYKINSMAKYVASTTPGTWSGRTRT
jgi:hypothetical protein